MLRKSLIGLLCLTFLFSLTLVYGQAQTLDQPVHLRYASSPIGGTGYVTAATMADVWRPLLPPKSTIDVLPRGLSIGGPLMVAKGDAELAQSWSVALFWAYKGIVAFKEPLTNLRGIAGYAPEFVQGGIVRKDLNINSLKDIKEKKLPVRLFTVTRSGAGYFGSELLAKVYGFTWDDIKAWGGSVQHTSFEAIVTAFKDGRADIFLQGISPGHPTFTEIAVSVPVKFFSVEPDIMKKMEEYGYYPSVLPKGSFKGQDYDVPLPGMTSSLVCRDNLPETLVYILTKGLAEHTKELAKGSAEMAKYDPKLGSQRDQVGLPLHPGAERYYRERGWIK